jgi:outer membrane protein OmpA-like peptidoglycan-associated protein
MESDWLRLLRPITGSMKVNLNITRVPSRFHLPGYRPVSKLPLEWLGLIRAQRFIFEEGSAVLLAADEEKLELLAYLMMEVGPELRVLVAGYSDPLGEPGGESLRLRRANLIRERLLDYGVLPEVVQASGFDAVREPGVLTDAQRRAGRSVEFLVQ